MAESDVGCMDALEPPTADAILATPLPGVFVTWRELVGKLAIWLIVLGAIWLPFILAGVWLYRRLHHH